jgi:dTDP-4-amino-4,6-dideoxygalactose transaminase
MADMDPIMEIARVYKLEVIEDACQAHGAEYKGRRAGSIGDAGCFSFYPGKNLGAYGEGGAVVTNNPELDEKIRMLHDHGQSKKYYHTYIGWNCRLEGIQGAILRVKLKHLPEWNTARRKHAQAYHQLLQEISRIILPQEAADALHVYHVYAIRVKNRDSIIKSLGEQGISCGIHYPVPVHLQAAYDFLNLRAGTYPVAEKCVAEFLSLPMYPELTAAQIQFAADEIQKSLSI